MRKLALIFAGLFITAVFLEIGLRIGGFILLNPQERQNRRSMREKNAYRIICLGESTTAAICDEPYPSQLEKILNAADIGKKFCVINLGIPGGNTSVIVSQLGHNLSEYRPDMVIAMMGINDLGMPKGPQFLRTLRIYKLITILSDRIANKFEEIGICRCNKVALDKNNNVMSECAFYVNLGIEYRKREKMDVAEKVFRKAIELNPGFLPAYFELAKVYLLSKRYIQAEKIYQEVLETEPRNESAYLELAQLYMEMKEYRRAEGALKKALVFGRGNSRVNEALASFYEKEGKSWLAEKYMKKAKKMMPYGYSDLTIRNYRRLKEVLDKKRIRLVCAQYPMRKIWPLKRLFSSRDGIIFVDNEAVFKEAVNTISYSDYFTDRFAGEFGHCTPKGNKLLADNIARTILNEVFMIKNSSQ